MAARLVILHLSDIQFGRHHRYPKGNDSYQTLFAKLVKDLEFLKEKHNVQPNAVVVTGDVAEWSVPQEYALARASFKKPRTVLSLSPIQLSCGLPHIRVRSPVRGLQPKIDRPRFLW